MILDGAHNPAGSRRWPAAPRCWPGNATAGGRDLDPRGQGRGRHALRAGAARLRGGGLHPLGEARRAAAGHAWRASGASWAARPARIDRRASRGAVRGGRAAGPEGAVLVTGSLYLLSELAGAGRRAARDDAMTTTCDAGPRRRRGRGRDPDLLRARIRPGADAPLRTASREPSTVAGGDRLPRFPGGRTPMTFALFGIQNDGLNLAVNLLVFFLFVIYSRWSTGPTPTPAAASRTRCWSHARPLRRCSRSSARSST